MWLRSGRALTIGLVLAAAACNALVGFEDEYRYFAGVGIGTADDDGGAGDAHPDASATPGTDGSSPEDGASATDAGGDAADAAPPLLPCAKGNPSIVWCDDFDTPRAGPSLGWDTKDALNGAATIVANGGMNDTAGLRVLTPPTQGASIRHQVGLWKTIGGVGPSTTKLVLSCRIKVDAIGNASGDTLYYAVLAAIRFNGTNGPYYGIARYNAGNGCPAQDCLDESQQGWTGGDARSFAGSVALGPRGTWHTVEITLTKSAGVWTSSASWDGFVDQDRPFSNLAMPSTVEVGVGVFYTDTDDGNRANMTMVVDDVAVLRE